MYEMATRLMVEDKNIDSLIVILGPPLMYDTLEIAHSICRGAKNTDKTVMLVLMSQDDIIPKVREVDPEHPPIFRFPETAARAIGQMLNFTCWQKTPIGNYKHYEIKENIVSSILESQNKTGEFYLEFNDVYKILESYGLPIIKSCITKDVPSSIKCANDLGYPLVIKAIGRELIHKTEVGGVMIDIHNDDELVNAERKILTSLKEKGIEAKLDGFLIQPYMRGGIETIMGVFKDPKAGHLIMFGLGGVMVEVIKDVKFQLLPINDVEAKTLVKSIQSYKLLTGVRGNPPVDLDYIEENLLRLSQLIEDFPVFTEIDFNPFVFKPSRKECKILDARIRVAL
jgi:acetyltransferase